MKKDIKMEKIRQLHLPSESTTDLEKWVPAFEEIGISRELLQEAGVITSDEDKKALFNQCAFFAFFFQDIQGYQGFEHAWQLQALGKKDYGISQVDPDSLGALPIHYQLFAGKKVKLPEVPPADNDDRTLLHYAALSSSLDVVKHVVDKYNGAIVKTQDNHANTALHCAACRNENLDIIEFLLKSGVPPALKNITNRYFIEILDQKISPEGTVFEIILSDFIPTDLWVPAILNDLLTRTDRLSPESTKKLSQYKELFYIELMKSKGRDVEALERAIEIDSPGHPSNPLSQIFHQQRGVFARSETVRKIQAVCGKLKAPRLLADLANNSDLDDIAVRNQRVAEGGRFKDQLYDELIRVVKDAEAAGKLEGCLALLKKASDPNHDLGKAFAAKRVYFGGEAKHIRHSVIALKNEMEEKVRKAKHKAAAAAPPSRGRKSLH